MRPSKSVTVPKTMRTTTSSVEKIQAWGGLFSQQRTSEQRTMWHAGRFGDCSCSPSSQRGLPNTLSSSYSVLCAVSTELGNFTLAACLPMAKQRVDQQFIV